MPIFNSQNRSLGGLRANPNHSGNPLAPQGLGRILLTRELIEILYEQLQGSHEDLVEAAIACWNNVKQLKHGADKFITIEVNALSGSDRRWWSPEKPEVNTLEDFFI